jgi:hypothetical protein
MAVRHAERVAKSRKVFMQRPPGAENGIGHFQRLLVLMAHYIRRPL